jgi:Haem-degrading
MFFGGGVVIKLGNEVIGSIGASGTPGAKLDDGCAHAGLAIRRENPTRRIELNRLPQMEFVRRHRPHRFRQNAPLGQKFLRMTRYGLSPYATIARHGGKPMTILRVTRRKFMAALGCTAAVRPVARARSSASRYGGLAF